MVDTQENNSSTSTNVTCARGVRARFHLLSFYTPVRDLNTSIWGEKSMRASVCGVKVAPDNELLTSSIRKSPLFLVTDTKIWCFSCLGDHYFCQDALT